METQIVLAKYSQIEWKQRMNEEKSLRHIDVNYTFKANFEEGGGF